VSKHDKKILLLIYYLTFLSPGIDATLHSELTEMLM